MKRKLIFVQFLGGEKLLEKCRREILKWREKPEKGLLQEGEGAPEQGP